MTLLFPYGEPVLSGLIKQQAEDFRVDEQLGFELTGEGEHLYLHIEKTGLTTHELIQQLAAAVGLHPRLIGYSGLKDKQAITRQWISLHLPGAKQMPRIEDNNQFTVLKKQWHDKKLRVGVHRSNRFTIVVRNLTGQSDNLGNIIDKIRLQGFANYFGEQRFGINQNNVEQALKHLTNRHKARRLSRQRKSLYISALRSEIFNAILSSRIAQGVWQQPLSGDLFILDGTHSVFDARIDSSIQSRYRELDIHCAVSLYGEGESRIKDLAAALEQGVFDRYPEITKTLLHMDVKYAYRAHRALARNLQIELEPETKRLHLQVELEKGVFLTTLLRHLIQLSTGLS